MACCASVSGMGISVEHATPVAGFQTVSGRSCPECYHEGVGRGKSPLSMWLTEKLHLKTFRIQCATYQRDDVMGDVHYCACSNAAHLADLRTGFENHIEETQ